MTSWHPFRTVTVVLLLWQSSAAGLSAAENFPVRHPVLKHDLEPAKLAKSKAAADVLLDKSDDELAEQVPRQTPFITCDCPACGAQTYTRGPDRILWQFDFPGEITCRKCQTKFPNERFANNHTASLLNTRGETIDVPCYRDTAGKQFFLAATIDSWRSAALTAGVTALAKSYATTKNEDHARRVAVVLAEYARHFPHYLVKDFLTAVDNPPGERGAQRSRYEFVSTGGPWIVAGKPRGKQPSEPEASEQETSTPYGWTQSRWGWGRWANEVPEELLAAYDLVYESPVFERLSAERGKDVRKQIEVDLFRNAADWVMAYPFYYHIHNNAGSQVAAVIHTGMVLGEPRYLAFGDRWGKSVLEQYTFSRDAAFGESPGYFYVFLATQEGNFKALQEAASLAGSGPEATAAKARAQRALDFLARSQATIESTCFPNGSSLPLSDNRHDEFADPTYRPGVRGKPKTESTNVLLPGYGHAVLGAGSGDRQIQVHLHFSPFKEVIHTHADGLSLMLWAFGSEMFTDIGYNRTKYRPWASTTLSHNTVVVDRAGQDGSETKGRLLNYVTNPRGWSFVQVEDAGAYGAPVTRYRRSLLLNATDLEAPYLVDIFEVQGGQMHDYALHGPTVFESTATTDLPLTPLAGERPLLNADEAANFEIAKHPYGLFTNVRAGAPKSNFAVTWRLDKPFELPPFTPHERYPAGKSFHYAIDPASYADRGELGVRTHFVGLDEQAEQTWQVILADTPSLLRGGLLGSPLTETLKRPSLLVRHEGKDPLSTVFIAVHEPYYRAPKITSVRRLETAEAECAVALEIKTAKRTDDVVLALEPPPISIGSAETVTLAWPRPIIFQGRLAVVQRTGDSPPEKWTVDAAHLVTYGVKLSGCRSYSGEIDAVTSVWNGRNENTFVTSAELPEGQTLHGQWMIVRHGDSADEGYQIDRIERRDGKSIIHLADDPGLRILGDKTEEIFFPRRQWTGASRFTVANPEIVVIGQD